MKRTLALTFLVLTLPARSQAGQPPAAPPAPTGLPCRDLVETVRTAKDHDAKALAATDVVRLNLHATCLSELVLSGVTERTSFAHFLKELESRRTDKQAGASGGSGGGTTAVVKGTTAKVLSLAAEYGAITESVNKQIVTVQGSLDGIPAALVRHTVFPYCPTSAVSPDCLNANVFEWLRRVSYGISFDTSQHANGATGTPAGAAQGSAQPVTFEASGKAITAATVKVVLWNARDATSPTFQKAWVAAVKKGAATTATPAAAAQPSSPLLQAADALRQSMAAFLAMISANKDFLDWQTRTVTRLTSASDADLDEAWIDRARVLTAIVQKADPNAASLAASFAAASSTYRFEEDEVVRTVAEKPVMTLQYDYKRPTSAPTTSSVRLIFDKGFDEHWSVAANGAVEIYDQTPSADISNASRLRDAQFGFQVQYDLGKLAVLGAAAVSGTYYFQYQNSPSILNVTPASPLTGITFVSLAPGAKQVFADKGHLHLAQFRLVLGPRESSARFPVAISYSNRTELIDKPVWRAQIGVSYDFDALFAK